LFIDLNYFVYEIVGAQKSAQQYKLSVTCFMCSSRWLDVISEKELQRARLRKNDWHGHA